LTKTLFVTSFSRPRFSQQRLAHVNTSYPGPIRMRPQRKVANEALGRSVRSLQDLIKKGLFPPPDVTVNGRKYYSEQREAEGLRALVERGMSAKP
jgi:MerR HTH family regulatory protein